MGGRTQQRLTPSASEVNQAALSVDEGSQSGPDDRKTCKVGASAV